MQSLLFGILAATLGGAAIGLERQRSGKASGIEARFGGLRTFTLLGGIAGVAGTLARLDFVGFAIALVSGAIAVVVAAYFAASRRDIDATTEVAALVVIAAGIIAGLGEFVIANGIIAVTAVLLVEKPRLHAFAKRVDDEEMRAAALFGVMALVILPLLPEGPIGPFGGIRPRELWLLVLFFSGLSFAGYLARRAVGARAGYPLAGLLGGLVSSTSVSLTFSRLSRAEPALSRPLAFGVIAACTVLFPRVLVATAILDVSVVPHVALYLAAPFAVGLTAMAFGMRRAAAEYAPEDAIRNPLQLMAAIQMVLMFQLVLFAIAFVRQSYGDTGLLASGIVLGLTDVDALTVSMTRGVATGVTAAIAAKAIAIGILSNTVLKMALTLTLGSPSLRRIAGVVLGAMSVALALLVGLR